MKNKIILASGSPRRRELLTQIGIQYQVAPSEVDETVSETNPVRVVEELSLRKAIDVADRQNEDCIILGADTVVTLEQQILGKPVNKAEAFQMLHSLQGRTHQVYTGVTILQKEKGKLQAYTFHEETKVIVVSMNETEINDYIATGEPMDKAGAYGIQGAFAAYVKGIEGDYYNVVGLPVCRVAQELKKRGF